MKLLTHFHLGQGVTRLDQSAARQAGTKSQARRQERPQGGQERLKTDQERAKSGQEQPKSSAEQPKSGPERPKSGPKVILQQSWVVLGRVWGAKCVFFLMFFNGF